MTDAFDDLYQEIILDHYRRPLNYGELPEATHQADGYNPLCGDRIHLSARMEGPRLVDVRFTGSGCAISKSSASLMTQAVKGKTKEEIENLFQHFHDMVTGKTPADDAPAGKLRVLAGVRNYPSRVKCATLAWHTLHAALHGGGHVSTEKEEKNGSREL